MNAIEEMKLLDEVAAALQNQFTYAQMDIYFKKHSIELPQYWDGDSTRVYAQHVLGHVSHEKIKAIAAELGIHTGDKPQVSTSSYWRPSHYRVFISHVSSIARQASALSNELEEFGISSFVAHEDIEPSSEWLIEIEKGLFSADALIALITEEFPKSNWTDQETGIAMGRQIPVIPIRIRFDPYGFLGKYQGLNAHHKVPRDVATAISQIFIKNPIIAPIYSSRLAHLLVQVNQSDYAKGFLYLLKQFSSLNRDVLDLLATQISPIKIDAKLKSELDGLFAKHGHAGFRSYGHQPVTDDEIPF